MTSENDNGSVLNFSSDKSFEVKPSSYTFDNYDDMIDETWKFNELMGIMPTNSNINRKRIKNSKGKRKAQRNARRKNR